MARIPRNINGVEVEFANTVNRTVGQKIIEALELCIKPNVAEGHSLATIYVSSANDSHRFPSRHVQGMGKAVDISRINRKKMSTHYNNDPAVRAITNAIQECFETYEHRRENFGPLFKKKNGETWKVSGHKDHIHLSVN